MTVSARANVAEFAMRLAGAYAVLLLLAVILSEPIVNTVLPLLRWELGWLLPDFRIDRLAVVSSGYERVIALSAETLRPIDLGGIWPAGVMLESSTLLGHALQPALLALSLLWAWPVRGGFERVALLVCGLVALLLVALLDTPVVLAGALVDLMAAQSASAPEPLLATLMNFLNSGGRLLLGLMVVALATALFGAVRRWCLRVAPERQAVGAG
jgi:hypothetical protein